MAATAVFEPCCPGGGGGYTACFYTTTTYAEMCQIAECTEALNAADRACQGLSESSSAAQAYQGLRLAVNCAGLDDPCVESVQETMDSCQLSATLEGDPTALMNAAAVICTEPQCTQRLHEQVEQCSGAQDFSTALAVGMFSTILATCDAAAGAGAALTCSDRQMAQLMETCYTDKDHTQPNCEACYPLLVTLMSSCPASFMAGAGSELGTMCAAGMAAQCPDIADSSTTVTTTCCDEPTEDCSSGMPASCNQGCAQVFIPFMHDCGSLLGPQAAMFGDLLRQCEAACPNCGAGGGH